MPSPFPGMDPYLEDPRLWSEVHGGMMYAVQAQLTPQLGGHYRAVVDRSVWLTRDDRRGREPLGHPDVFVPERHGRDNGTLKTLSAIAVEVPARTRFAARRRRGPRFLKIVDQFDRRVVTVIELLSPVNKSRSPGGVAYRAKRDGYLSAEVNFVEVDCLRTGGRLPLGRPDPPTTDYCALVVSAAEFPAAMCWPFTVRDAMPRLPVPLRSDEPAVELDLRACLDSVYDHGAFHHEIDYTRPPVPPLADVDAIWAAELLKSNGIA